MTCGFDNRNCRQNSLLPAVHNIAWRMIFLCRNTKKEGYFFRAFIVFGSLYF